MRLLGIEDGEDVLRHFRAPAFSNVVIIFDVTRSISCTTSSTSPRFARRAARSRSERRKPPPWASAGGASPVHAPGLRRQALPL